MLICLFHFIVIDIMQQPRDPPFVFVLIERAGQSAHKSLGGQHVLDKVRGFDMLMQQLQGLLAGRNPIHYLSAPSWAEKLWFRGWTYRLARRTGVRLRQSPRP